MDTDARDRPAFVDPWGRVPVPVEGVLERHAFPPWLTALFAPVVAFVAFQFLAIPLVLVPLLLVQGVEAADLPDVLPRLLQDYTATTLTANTVAQLLGLALLALWLTRLHSSDVRAFLRLRRVDVGLLILSVLGLAAGYPVVQWLGAVNQQLPLPEVIEQMEQGRFELIERALLSSGLPLWFTLTTLAVTPALCEELFFRGYLQRQAERGMGVAAGIAFSGLVFGAFHLTLSQVLPLSALGLYLAYLTWRTGSLWPAVIVHFANNGFAVLAGAYARNDPTFDLDNIETMQVPAAVLLPAAVLFAILMFWLHRRARVLLARHPTGEPA